MRVKRSSSIIDHNAQWRFTKDGRPCGIGFEIEADALCFVMNLPASPSSALCGADSAIQRAARTARFIWEAQYGPALAGVADNVFLRNWLAQVFQVAAVALAQERACTLEEAIAHLQAPTETERLEGVLLCIFQSPDAPDEEASAGSVYEPRLRKKLSASLADGHARRRLRHWPVASSPVQSMPRGMTGCAARNCRLLPPPCSTLSSKPALRSTRTTLWSTPTPGPAEDGTLPADPELWISEVNPGGNGLIEQVIEAIATHPDHLPPHRSGAGALGVRANR
ncbi:MAG: hypothetical protein IPO20_18320 [Gammaproteobacteria bacterium]|nr:hypothetical protein [Gammaproteobacteria bacterium]